MLTSADWQRLQRRLVPMSMWPWLSETGSLTRRLIAHNEHDFSVSLLKNEWKTALLDEASLLGINPKARTFQRAVHLMDGVHANVYARTIVPRVTFEAMRYRFNQLGNTSLGEVLFTDPSVIRAPIEIACLKPGQTLYHLAMQGQDIDIAHLWARRSVFTLGGKKLLVNEIFLPTLIWS